jgi:molybdate-binding protein
VVVAGCDPALPLLAGPLARQDPPLGLLWWPCSSSRALELVESGAAHAAGAHLRDRNGGGYNTQQTREVLGAVGAAVVGFASWTEGLVVGSGSIRDLTDVARLGLRVVNREPGAEAREVLDRERSRRGLAIEDLPGWNAVVGGHLQVAAAVASGLADAGVTCEPAARAYGLGFQPLTQERFDLVIPRALLATPEVRGLLAALGSDELRRQLAAIDGYDASSCGTVVDTF